MTCRHFGLAAFLILAVTLSAAGQEQPPQRVQVTVDVDKLPVDLQRIQRQLRQAAVREERDGLNLRYFVDVYGRAPRIELFSPTDVLLTGPIPYGAPTHREMIEAITPREYRAPAADLGALFRWLSDRTRDRDGER